MDGEEPLGCSESGIRVSLFDYSVENHFKAMDSISRLCRMAESEADPLEEAEFQRLSSSITFLKEWRHFNYERRMARFAYDKDVIGEVNLPQFSSATVPKVGQCEDSTSYLKSSKDFLMYVGGSVWALDWCPMVRQSPESRIRCEFLAIAAHPSDSYYHKIGVPLVGRGILQIWCIVNINEDEEEVYPSNKKRKQRGVKKSTELKVSKGRPRKKLVEGSPGDEDLKRITTQIKRPRGRPRKKLVEGSPGDEDLKRITTQIKRPRGRPRKKPKEALDGADCDNQNAQLLAVQYPEDSSEPLALEWVSGNSQEHLLQKQKSRKRKSSSAVMVESNSAAKTTGHTRNSSKDAERSDGGASSLLLLTEKEGEGSSTVNHQLHETSENDALPCHNLLDNASLEDVALPRVVLCLAHNGKVAWDVKWRPLDVANSKYQHRMGYLAVLLGNGSVEVWDVPLPRTIKLIYSSSHREGTDPRFVKLEPVFKCSFLKCGETKSIPLTVEWSTSKPYEYLLVGCHDGTVALWKFTGSGNSGDSRPLLCFSADTVPIRAVAWAPVECDQENASIIVTAGHAGLKFWDIQCLLLSFDDGTMRLLSLVKAAYDAPVNGTPSVGPKQLGMHVFNCSSFAIWSVQVSRPTGMVAYCSADGTVCRFQLTTKAVEKDPSRNKAPHFVCGSLSEEESVITINTPLPGIPLTLKKQVSDVGENPRSLRSFLSEPSQCKRTTNSKAKAQDADSQQLALCYGDDPALESGSEETLTALKRKGKTKSKCGDKRRAREDQRLICRDEELDDVLAKQSETGGAGNEAEVIPSKIVAMHRVRWNMNEGSERWLSSGGAAGIVRCQEIIFSDVDELMASKR
ncbi:hypothetical protein K2173_018541 [Erythroxylum novogranatense]|uniref:Transducin/WD40 repeat-like superfamily protein n=1 Tax=Erythroxylum novogranatense TaxID=1862640 RepID=A0AAV8UE56_9ROSI|nr:hypothetical protein K2173_018541 [Erythroxylum novogranatense]